MTMAAFGTTAETARPSLFALAVDSATNSAPAPACALDHLSMGMSNDFETAVEEGRDARSRRLGSVRGTRT